MRKSLNIQKNDLLEALNQKKTVCSAARILGVTRAYVHRLITRFNIKKEVVYK